MQLRMSRSMVAAFLLAAAAACGQSDLPRLERRGAATQLIVGGRPFLILGGELGNNTATTLDNARPLWPRLAAMNLNTALVALSWAQIEPEEGKFDWTLVDGLIQDARQANLRLVFLWFGSWKNTWSSYAPDWVKRDYQRFPRVRLRDGTATERPSPFNDACRDADARTYAALMRRIREVDGNTHTVLMMQVENEVGVIPDARDHSPAASAITAAYGVLSQLAPLVLEYQARGAGMDAVVLEELAPAQRVRVGDYTLEVSSTIPIRRAAAAAPGQVGLPSADDPPVPHGIFIAAAPNEYILAGRGLSIRFRPETPGPAIAGLGTVQEGRFVNGKWVVSRQLAGDDTGQGTSLTLRGNGAAPAILRVTLYRYQ